MKILPFLLSLFFLGCAPIRDIAPIEHGAQNYGPIVWENSEGSYPKADEWIPPRIVGRINKGKPWEIVIWQGNPPILCPFPEKKCI